MYFFFYTCIFFSGIYSQNLFTLVATTMRWWRVWRVLRQPRPRWTLPRSPKLWPPISEARTVRIRWDLYCISFFLYLSRYLSPFIYLSLFLPLLSFCHSCLPLFAHYFFLSLYIKVSARNKCCHPLWCGSMSTYGEKEPMPPNLCHTAWQKDVIKKASKIHRQKKQDK